MNITPPKSNPEQTLNAKPSALNRRRGCAWRETGRVRLTVWCSYARKITTTLLHKFFTITSLTQLCSNFHFFCVVNFANVPYEITLQAEGVCVAPHSHSHTHALAHTHTHALTHSHTHTLTHSHTHTLTHVHTHTRR